MDVRHRVCMVACEPLPPVRSRLKRPPQPPLPRMKAQAPANRRCQQRICMNQLQGMTMHDRGDAAIDIVNEACDGTEPVLQHRGLGGL